MSPIKSALILCYAVAAMGFAVAWQTVEDIRDMHRAQREMRGWWDVNDSPPS